MMPNGIADMTSACMLPSPTSARTLPSMRIRSRIVAAIVLEDLADVAAAAPRDHDRRSRACRGRGSRSAAPCSSIAWSKSRAEPVLLQHPAELLGDRRLHLLTRSSIACGSVQTGAQRVGEQPEPVDELHRSKATRRLSRSDVEHHARRRRSAGRRRAGPRSQLIASENEHERDARGEQLTWKTRSGENAEKTSARAWSRPARRRPRGSRRSATWPTDQSVQTDGRRRHRHHEQ